MIQKQSKISVSDNSGAREIMCIRIVPGTKKVATAGNVIIAVIKKALPTESLDTTTSHKSSSLSLKTVIKKSEIVLAAIIRTKAYLNRDNGFHIAFDSNAAVLIKTDKTPRGNRIFGPVAKEVKKAGLAKIVSLATYIV